MRVIATIQDAIDLAVEQKSNVLAPAFLVDDENIKALRDSRDCHVFIAPDGMIRVVPKEYITSLGGHGPTITVEVPDKARSDQG